MNMMGISRWPPRRAIATFFSPRRRYEDRDVGADRVVDQLERLAQPGALPLRQRDPVDPVVGERLAPPHRRQMSMISLVRASGLS